VLFRDQIGDFLVATPLMRGLREQYPTIILDYFGGARTRELEEASRLIDARYGLFGEEASAPPLDAFLEERRRVAGPYDLAINLESDQRAAVACGLIAARYTVGGWSDGSSTRITIHPSQPIDRLWDDFRWNRADLRTDFPELHSQYIGEIFCRLARVDADSMATEAPIAPPPGPVPDVLLSTGANRSAKLWPVEHWLMLARWLSDRGISAGLLGAPPRAGDPYHADQADARLIESGVVDLRGALTLPQVGGALAQTRAFITVDNGLMHLAGAVGAPTIALFGASPQRLWAPPSPSVQVLEPAEPCLACEENRFRNAECLLPVHQCLLSVRPDRVIDELQRILERRCPE
jgi:ADP-heptose:LPS heptosyltransferase